MLTQQLRASFVSKDFSVKNKDCKYLISVLLKIFQRPKVQPTEGKPILIAQMQVAIVIGRTVMAELLNVVFDAFGVIDAKMVKQKPPSDTPPTDSALSSMFLFFCGVQFLTPYLPGMSKGLGMLIKAMLKNADMTASFGILFESLDNCLSDKELSKRIGGVVIKSLLVVFRYLQVIALRLMIGIISAAHHRKTTMLWIWISYYTIFMLYCRSISRSTLRMSRAKPNLWGALQ